MKYRLVLATAVVVAALSIPAAAQQPVARQALDGIDPVVLIQQGKEAFGKPEFSVERGGFQYQFSSAETKAAFEREPARYEIQLNGSCARMGGGVGGNPSDYAVVEGKIYIFGSDECHKRFVAAPARFLPRPVPPMPTAASALEQGRALVDRAVAGLGGGATLDSVTSYAEAFSQIQKRTAGDVAVITNTVWRFPDAVRSERVMALQGQQQTSTTLLTAQGGWFIGGNGRVYPQNPGSRATNRQEFSRQLIPLLRTRHDPSFKAAAVGRTVVDGTEVDQVRIQNGVVDVTLGIDAKTGRLHSLAFTGRNAEAEIGDYTLIFGDYRQVNGLTLPFEVRALFDGAPDSLRTVKFDSLKINAPVDPALFEAPKGDAK